MIAGRYSLEREIGRGGMGSVWLGRDEVLGRSVAVKRLGVAPGQEAPDLERADREARLAARLSHPHIVAVYDLVEHEGQQYLVMEHVRGTNLSGMLAASGPLTLDRAAELLGQAADALAAAHEAGIVHRDVKPSNMLVDDEGQVKLSDFGIARAEADPSLTQTGLVTGSPAYLAPEVASGATASTASDVWSLGASLHHALAGHPPYQVQDNVLGTLYRIVHEEPPRLDAGWLTPVLEATMTRDPAQRWPMARVRDVLLAGAPAGSASAPGRASAVATGAATSAEGTQVLSSIPPASIPPVNTGPQPVLSPGPAVSRPRRSAGGVLVGALLAVAVVVLLVVVAFAVGQGRDPGSDEAGAGDPSATSASTPGESSAGASADDLESFASSYVQTAVDDPDRGFTMLTTDYQEASDGLAGYRRFWSNVTKVVDFSADDADPTAGTVTYTYTYRLRGGQERTETIELTLQQQDDGSFLIAGARTV